MTLRCWSFVASILLVFPVGPAGAEHEEVGGHAKHPTHTVILDNGDIRPSNVTMDGGDVLVFENHSLEPIKVTFTDPADLKDRIRCGLVKEKPGDKTLAPWQLFAWENGKLVGTIPPGRFASVCSLQEGSYAFLATPLNTKVRQPAGGGLPEKGQIVVK